MRLSLIHLIVIAPLCACDHSPPWCTPQAPLDASCTGSQCVAAVVVDYKRLEPRGWRVFSLSGSSVDQAGAAAKAVEHVQKVEKADPPDMVDAVAAGSEFFNCFLGYNSTKDSWLVVVHALSGQVVFAGLEFWADQAHRGYDPPLGDGYHDASALGCTDGAKDPVSKMLVTTGIPFGSAPASTAEQAWDVARRLNLVEQFTANASYRLMVVSYAAAQGEFDAVAADWYVWIARR
jgi:hypothetical protein